MKSTGYPPPTRTHLTTEKTRHYLKLTSAITAGFAGILAVANVHAVELTIDAEHPAQWLSIKPSSWALLQNNEPNVVNINVYDDLSVSTNVIQAAYQKGVDVSGNSITIQSNRETPWFTGLKLNGVQVENGNAYSNTLTISGGNYTFRGSKDGISAAYVRQGEASNNILVVKDKVDVYGGLHGAYVWRPQGTLYNNGVKIESNAFSKDELTAQMDITGLYIETAFDAYTAKDNWVEITGGTFKNQNIIAADLTQHALASGNIVTISGGTFENTTIYGIRKSGDKNSSANGVIVTGGSFLGKNTIYASSQNTSTSENPDFVHVVGTDRSLSLAGVRLYGNSRSPGSARLIFEDCRGLETGSIGRFNDVLFINTEWQTEVPAVTLTEATINTVRIDPERGFSVSPDTRIRTGDRMTLLKSEYSYFGSNFMLPEGDNETLYTQAGVARKLSGKLYQASESTVDFEVTSVELSEQTVLLAENRAVAAAFINEGDAALKALDTPDTLVGYSTFATAEGAASEYSANDDLKINGWHFAAGVQGLTNLNSGASLTSALYFEAGNGNYRTENSFNGETFSGSGDLNYRGGGLAVRYRLASDFYVEGSVRAGELKTEMDRAVRASSGELLGYSLRSFYWGAHAGLGQILENDASTLDLYGRIYHTEVDGENFNLGGDRFVFGDVKSTRTRIGAKIRSKAWGIYAGAAAEYEFDGDAKMTAADLDAPTESLKGLSMMGEVGWSWAPDTSPWALDVRVGGWGGARRGVVGQAYCAYRF